MTSRLLLPSPLVHRMAHRLATTGVRGAGHYWRLAERVRPLPARGRVRIGEGPSVEVRPGDAGERLLYRGLHERVERVVVGRLVDEGSTCLDVGANIGSYTALMAVLTGRTGHVVAFEPARDIRRRLESAVEGMPWVTVLPFALGGRSEQAVLSSTPHHAGASTLRSTAGETAHAVTVEVRRLDELAVLGDLPVIDVMKIDVEGWEGPVLEGSGDLISEARVGALMVEASPEFGPLDHLAPLLDHEHYSAWAIRPVPSRTGLRIRPCLVPVHRLAEVSTQQNLLFVRDDRLWRVEDLLARPGDDGVRRPWRS